MALRYSAAAVELIVSSLKKYHICKKEKAIRQHHTNIFQVQCVQLQALLLLMNQELSVKESIISERSRVRKECRDRRSPIFLEKI